MNPISFRTVIDGEQVIRPPAGVVLPQGPLEVIVKPVGTDADRTPPEQDRGIADALAAIAALPMEVDDQGFSGSDHDKVLYGEQGAR
jgi:hypothetical protein